MRLIVAGLGTVVMLLGSIETPAQSVLDKSKSGATTSVPTGDPGMAAAMQKAKATLPEFLKLAKAPPSGTTGFAVRIGIPYDGGSEFVWMNSLEFKGDNIIGAIANEPRHAKNVKYRERISFRERDIADWMYRESGKMKGNFTTCALLQRDTPANREAFRKQYGLECEF